MPERAPQPAMRQMRMPAIEEFPPQVKRQIEAQQSRIESIAEHAQKKKPGLFQRLASVGLGRKDDPPPPAPREPSIAMQNSRSARLLAASRRSPSRSRRSIPIPASTMISWRFQPSCAAKRTD